MHFMSKPPIPSDLREYTHAVGKFIANEFSKGAGLPALVKQFRNYVPPMMTINRWRAQIPAFNILMIEAERARAEFLVEERITLADDINKPAAHTRNGMVARMDMAGALDPERYGTKRIHTTGTHQHNVTVEGAHALTNEQLLVIAAGGVIEGVSTRIDPPAPPLSVSEGVSFEEVRGISQPTTKSRITFVDE